MTITTAHSRRGRFECYRSPDGDWRWRLKAPNGRVIASGEGYRTRSGVKRAIEAIMIYAADPEIEVLP